MEGSYVPALDSKNYHLNSMAHKNSHGRGLRPSFLDGGSRNIDQNSPRQLSYAGRALDLPPRPADFGTRNLDRAKGGRNPAEEFR